MASTIRLMTWNIDRNRSGKTLEYLISLSQRPDRPDVICLQECHSRFDYSRLHDFENTLLYQLGLLLSDYDGPYSPLAFQNAPGIETRTQATFIHDDLMPFDQSPATQECWIIGESSKKIPVNNTDFYPRSMLCCTAKLDSRAVLNVYGVHGFYSGGDKRDIPQRIEQSRHIVKGVRQTAEPSLGTTYAVIMGDFNILRDSESYRILRKEYNEATESFGLQNSRNKTYLAKNGLKNLICDFIFTTRNIKLINCFTEDPAICDELSDHYPIFADIELA